MVQGEFLVGGYMVFCSFIVRSALLLGVSKRESIFFLGVCGPLFVMDVLWLLMFSMMTFTT